MGETEEDLLVAGASGVADYYLPGSGRIVSKVAGSLLGKKSAKRAAAARRRGLNQISGEIEQYDQIAEGAHATSIADLERSKARINAGYRDKLRLIDDDRRVAEEGFGRQIGYSEDNLEEIRAQRDAALAEYQPYLKGGAEASQLLADIYRGGSAADEAFAKFRTSTGYDTIKEEGLGAIDSRVSASGLRRSGSQQKAIAKFVGGLADESFETFQKGLYEQAGLGQRAAEMASQDRQAFQRLSVEERREMQNLVEDLITNYENANDNEREAIQDRIDKLAEENGHIREALSLYVGKKAGVTDAKINVIGQRTNVNTDQIAENLRNRERILSTAPDFTDVTREVAGWFKQKKEYDDGGERLSA